MEYFNKIIVYSFRRINFSFTKSFVKMKELTKIYLNSMLDEICDYLLVVLAIVMFIIIVTIVSRMCYQIIVS